MSKSTKVQFFTQIYAPRYYNAYLISGECFWFYHENTREGLGFWAEAGGGWRETGAMTSGGSPDNPVKLPLGAQITWLSRTEKKYYQAIIHLPQEKMMAEFNTTFDFEWARIPNQQKYSMIEFALAPGGFVALRLGGGKTKEIATFQAQEIEVTWDFFARTNHFSPDTLPEAEFAEDHYKTLPKPIQEQVDNHTFPLIRWKEYSETTFNWHFATNMELAGCRICCVNADNQFYNTQQLKDLKVLPQQHAPAWISLFYKENGKRYQTFIRFTDQRQGIAEQPTDDIAIFELFKSYFSSHPTSTALILEKHGGIFTAQLNNGSKKIEIPIHQVDTDEVDNKDLLWF